MTKSIVLYTGPSMFDGMPIVVLATLGSSNVKTGPLVQTFIMRADGNGPHENNGDDSSVCDNCPRRHFLGGDCYVTRHQAPLSTWKLWGRNGKPNANLDDAIVAIGSTVRRHGMRMGSYGDPLAVPFEVWAKIMSAFPGALFTGYTHAWRGRDVSDHWAWGRENLMASCDTTSEAVTASANGWRYFLATPVGVTPPPKAIMCLADRPNSETTCEDCGICDGAKGKPSRASVFIVEHGMRSSSKAKRVAALDLRA